MKNKELEDAIRKGLQIASEMPHYTFEQRVEDQVRSVKNQVLLIIDDAVAIERSQTQGLQAAASPGSEREGDEVPLCPDCDDPLPCAEHGGK